MMDQMIDIQYNNSIIRDNKKIIMNVSAVICISLKITETI